MEILIAIQFLCKFFHIASAYNKICAKNKPWHHNMRSCHWRLKREKKIVMFEKKSFSFEFPFLKLWTTINKEGYLLHNGTAVFVLQKRSSNSIVKQVTQGEKSRVLVSSREKEVQLWALWVGFDSAGSPEQELTLSNRILKLNLNTAWGQLTRGTQCLSTRDSV